MSAGQATSRVHTALDLAAQEEHLLKLALAKSAVKPASTNSKRSSFTGATHGSNGRSSQAQALSSLYFFNGIVEESEHIPDGFYTQQGDFPEVCEDPSHFPSLAQLTKVRTADGDPREVVVVDHEVDATLNALEERALEVLSAERGLTTAAKVQALARLVVEQMGGAYDSEEALQHFWLAASAREKRLCRSVVVHLGRLSVGSTRHRALLFKLLADACAVPCKLLRGTVLCGSEDEAVNLVQIGKEEWLCVDLTYSPGALLRADEWAECGRRRQTAGSSGLAGSSAPGLASSSCSSQAAYISAISTSGHPSTQPVLGSSLHTASGSHPLMSPAAAAQAAAAAAAPPHLQPPPHLRMSVDGVQSYASSPSRAVGSYLTSTSAVCNGTDNHISRDWVQVTPLTLSPLSSANAQSAFDMLSWDLNEPLHMGPSWAPVTASRLQPHHPHQHPSPTGSCPDHFAPVADAYTMHAAGSYQNAAMPQSGMATAPAGSFAQLSRPAMDSPTAYRQRLGDVSFASQQPTSTSSPTPGMQPAASGNPFKTSPPPFKQPSTIASQPARSSGTAATSPLHSPFGLMSSSGGSIPAPATSMVGMRQAKEMAAAARAAAATDAAARAPSSSDSLDAGSAAASHPLMASKAGEGVVLGMLSRQHPGTVLHPVPHPQSRTPSMTGSLLTCSEPQLSRGTSSSSTQHSLGSLVATSPYSRGEYSVPSLPSLNSGALTGSMLPSSFNSRAPSGMSLQNTLPQGSMLSAAGGATGGTPLSGCGSGQSSRTTSQNNLQVPSPSPSTTPSTHLGYTSGNLSGMFSLGSYSQAVLDNMLAGSTSMSGPRASASSLISPRAACNSHQPAPRGNPFADSPDSSFGLVGSSGMSSVSVGGAGSTGGGGMSNNNTNSHNNGLMAKRTTTASAQLFADLSPLTKPSTASSVTPLKRAIPSGTLVGKEGSAQAASALTTPQPGRSSPEAPPAMQPAQLVQALQALQLPVDQLATAAKPQSMHPVQMSANTAAAQPATARPVAVVEPAAVEATPARPAAPSQPTTAVMGVVQMLGAGVDRLLHALHPSTEAASNSQPEGTSKAALKVVVPALPTPKAPSVSAETQKSAGPDRPTDPATADTFTPPSPPPIMSSPSAAAGTPALASTVAEPIGPMQLADGSGAVHQAGTISQCLPAPATACPYSTMSAAAQASASSAASLPSPPRPRSAIISPFLQQDDDWHLPEPGPVLPPAARSLQAPLQSNVHSQSRAPSPSPVASAERWGARQSGGPSTRSADMSPSPSPEPSAPTASVTGGSRADSDSGSSRGVPPGGALLSVPPDTRYSQVPVPDGTLHGDGATDGAAEMDIYDVNLHNAAAAYALALHEQQLRQAQRAGRLGKQQGVPTAAPDVLPAAAANAAGGDISPPPSASGSSSNSSVHAARAGQASSFATSGAGLAVGPRPPHNQQHHEALERYMQAILAASGGTAANITLPALPTAVGDTSNMFGGIGLPMLPASMRLPTQPQQPAAVLGSSPPAAGAGLLQNDVRHNAFSPFLEATPNVFGSPFPLPSSSTNNGTKGVFAHGFSSPSLPTAAAGTLVASSTSYIQEQDQVHASDSEPSEVAHENLTYRSSAPVKAGRVSSLGDWEINGSELSYQQRIGKGSYGEVYKGTWRGTDVAIKKFSHIGELAPAQYRDFCAEVAIMSKLRHPNTVLFMGAVMAPVEEMAIVSQYVPRGSLYRILHRLHTELDGKRRLSMAMDIAKGMEYLHHRNVVHRDLKSPNLLVDKDWSICVCDFGLSQVKQSTFLTSRSNPGTPEWSAPELLRDERGRITEKCDVFSYGVVLWELVTGQAPWPDITAMQVVGAVGFYGRRLTLPNDLHPAITALIQDCWNEDPALRPGFTQVLSRLAAFKELKPSAETMGLVRKQADQEKGG